MRWIDAASSPSRRLFVAGAAALFATGARSSHIASVPGKMKAPRVTPRDRSALHTFDPPSHVGDGITYYEIETKGY